MAARWILAVICALALAGCSEDASGNADSSDRGPTASTSASSAADPCDFRGGTFPREAVGGSESSVIRTAEVSQDSCIDRIAFEFDSLERNLPPRYVVSYEPGPFVDFNQGYEITVGGSAYLAITFEKTAATNLEGDLLYESQESVEPADLHHLQELRLVVAPEGAVKFVIGLDAERPFVIDGAASPPRVTVTIG
jgi:hypothetical protein